jgi:hypothetical protein
MTDDEFWESREVLSRIRRTAQARLGGPWAALGVTLVRVLATVPPKVQLAPVIGGPASLNLFVALVGASGRGKGVAEAIARQAVWIHDMDGNDVVPTAVPIGSGEGIARTYRPAGADGMTSRTAIFTSHEVDTLSSLTGRTGSTLGAELRKMFSGEPLGFANANATTRCLVEAHSYRAGVTIGVQPLRSGPLLAAADGGLPQRFIWLPVSDVDAPDVEPELPAPWELLGADWGHADTPVLLELPDEAVTEMVEHRRRVLREDPDVDPLDGHVLLVRAKVAAGLSILDGRSGISPEDWELASRVMEVSSAQRNLCQRVLDERSRHTRRAKAFDAAEHERMLCDSKFQQAKRAIMRRLEKLRDDEAIPRHLLRTGMKSNLRADFDPAMIELISEGAVFRVQTERGEAYTTVQGVHPSPSHLTSACGPGRTLDRSTPDRANADARPGKTSQRQSDSLAVEPAARNTLRRNGDCTKQTNGAPAPAAFHGPLCSTGCGRPAGPDGWCQPCGGAYGLSNSRHH